MQKLAKGLGCVVSCVMLLSAGSLWAQQWVDIEYVKYSDSAGRNIYYEFTNGQMLDPARIEIPNSTVLGRPAAEANTTYLWEMPFGSADLALMTAQGVCRLSLDHWQPQAGTVSGITVYAQDGDVYEVWGGDADVSWGLDYLDVHTLGYTLLGSATGTATFNGSYKHYVIVTETRVYIDAVERIGGDYLDYSYDSSNVDPWEAVVGEPDGWYAMLGLDPGYYSGGKYAGFIEFEPFSVDEDEQYISGVVSLGAFGDLVPAPATWNYEVELKNFQNDDELGQDDFRYYTYKMGGGSDVSPVDFSVNCEWYNGWHQGEFLENVLVISADINDYRYGEDEYEADSAVLMGYDPATTRVKLRAEIQSGQTLTVKYDINRTGWQTLWTYTLPGAGMNGFANLFPYVDIENGWDGPAHINYAALSRLAEFWLQFCDGDWRCEDVDIDHTDSIDMTELMVYINNWLVLD